MQAIVLLTAIIGLVSALVVPAPESTSLGTTNKTITSTSPFDLHPRGPDHEAICAVKNQAITNAIGKYCQGPSGHGFHIPSPWSRKGMRSDPSYHLKPQAWKIWINADSCRSHPHVTKEVCYDRFWKLCAGGGSHGANAEHYGPERCQHWVIPTQANDPLGTHEGELTCHPGTFVCD